MIKKIKDNRKGEKMNLSKKSLSFIEKNVLHNLGLESVTMDNLKDIVDFISDNIEIPLAQAKEAGESIDEDLLESASSVITEITTNPDW